MYTPTLTQSEVIKPIKFHLICYFIKDMPDGKLMISNSYDHYIISDDVDELLGFLYKPYRDIDSRELKLFYDLDEQVSHIFRLMSNETIHKVCESRRFDDADKLYYTRGHNFAIKGDIEFNGTRNPDYKYQYNAWFYDLKKFCYTPHNTPQNANDVYKLGIKLMDLCKKLGITTPTKANSEISILENNPVNKKLLPVYTKLPITDDMLHIARMIANHQAWTTNYKVGWFKDNTYDYDINSCYAYQLSKVRDFNNAEYTPYTKDYKYKSEIYKGNVTGYFRVKLTINDNVNCHPFYAKWNADKPIYPVGTWDTYLMLEEILALYKYKIGTCEILDGFYVYFKSNNNPMKVMVDRWYKSRQLGDDESKYFKAVMVEFIGKMLRVSDDNTPSETYNPLIVAWIYSQARLQVLKFIQDNELQEDIIAISTDGVLSTKQATKTQMVDKTVLGGWRYNAPEPVFVLSPGWLVTPSKSPHAMKYDELFKLFNDNPDNVEYIKTTCKIATVYEAEEIFDNIKLVGTMQNFHESINLSLLRGLQDRLYYDYPKCGKDILDGNVYESEPIRMKVKNG